MALLEVRELSVAFSPDRHSGSPKQALDRINLEVGSGETVALVGESGAGKSTLARAILRLVVPDSGEVRFDGTDLTGLDRKRLAGPRSRIGFVMQDSTAALNPRRKVLASVAAPLAARSGLDRRERATRAESALERVRLDPATGSRMPGELSGGQRQRVCLARAIVTEPDLLVCDEPLAGLDLITEAAMLELLSEVSRTSASLFITHDLFLAAAIADRIAVMERGRIVEEGPVREVLSRPAHPHTKALVEAIPPADPDPAWRDRHGIAGPVQPPFEAGTKGRLG